MNQEAGYRKEWLAVILPLALSGILLASVAQLATKSRHGWLVMACCFAAGAAIPVAYTVMLARSGRLFLRGGREIARNRARIEGAMPLGSILGAGLVGAGLWLGGLSRLVLVSALAGLLLGVWPGLLVNFLRLRREVPRS